MLWEMMCRELEPQKVQQAVPCYGMAIFHDEGHKEHDPDVEIQSAVIYFATMKCYSRFIEETYRRTGRYYFDRDWWTTRQAGCHLFRIDELEYEIARHKNEITIKIHIPSDADFSPSAVDQSLESAKRFFSQYYPETEGVEYCCGSWLLDSQLRGMVRENANIVSFQNRFEIFDEGEAGTDFIEWVFQRNSADTDYAEFPENTSLQRKLKKHLLAGGVIRNAHGRLIFHSS